MVQILKCGHLWLMCSFSGGDMNIKQGIAPRVSAKYTPGPKVLGVGVDELSLGFCILIWIPVLPRAFVGFYSVFPQFFVKSMICLCMMH